VHDAAGMVGPEAGGDLVQLVDGEFRAHTLFHARTLR
jgi:hypothetical protein